MKREDHQEEGVSRVLVVLKVDVDMKDLKVLKANLVKEDSVEIKVLMVNMVNPVEKAQLDRVEKKA